MDTLTHQVAQVIGEVSPDVVREVIERSNSKGYLFHGIKSNRCYEDVLNEGIKPLTPEGGYVSFWTSGSRLFSLGRGALATFDTTFFHNAHSHNTSLGEGYVTLAIAKYSDLEEALLVDKPFRPDSCMKISLTVPRELIQVIRIEIDYSGKGTSREKGQVQERLLLAELHRVLKEDYEPGGLSVVKARF